MKRNLGETSLRSRRRSADPMRAYDSLPTPLRQWLSKAVLPWSPVSAHKIWRRAQAKGLNADEALALLCRAENQTLSRDKRASRPLMYPTE